MLTYSLVTSYLGRCYTVPDSSLTYDRCRHLDTTLLRQLDFTSLFDRWAGHFPVIWIRRFASIFFGSLFSSLVSNQKKKRFPGWHNIFWRVLWRHDFLISGFFLSSITAGRLLTHLVCEIVPSSDDIAREGKKRTKGKDSGKGTAQQLERD
ncbi:hypothetical protein BGZ63DRAFT_126308 [Mariannaea sp. PMI_226]|nr:hypothetical protein BGZ63DRAFT_126308 [Mariannaea sp. PMI_226]